MQAIGRQAWGSWTISSLLANKACGGRKTVQKGPEFGQTTHTHTNESLKNKLHQQPVLHQKGSVGLKVPPSSSGSSLDVKRKEIGREIPDHKEY